MIVLDFETTGLNPGYKPVEIAWVEFDSNFNEIEQVGSLINPHMPIEPGAQRTHGISAEMLANEPTLDDFLAQTHAGKFANELYTAALTTMPCSDAFSGDLLGAAAAWPSPCAACVRCMTPSVCAGALASRYLQHADVRFYTCVALKRYVHAACPRPICVAMLSRSWPRVRRLCDRGCMPATDRADAAGGASAQDVTRNAFDVLRNTPALFAAVDSENASWCGWEQAAAAADTASRKRAKAGSAMLAAGTPRWADAVSQRRAFSDAWLSLLRLELPLDVYKARAAPGLGHILPVPC
jgi:hypothetical protein